MNEAVEGTPSAAPASRDEADAWLRRRATRIVNAHLDTREDVDFARSVKSMTDKTVHEYGGRFLFELIQNGYDEQDPETRRGRLAIVFVQDEGDHGVLYVTNTGRGFTPSNVRAIANLGLSDKEIGAGIGNKGVGFKSVLQICDDPEIYSKLADGSPGFCFRFARPDDIPGLVAGDSTKVQYVLDEISLYNITVPAEGTPSRVADFWHEGYSTVIRLPLRAAGANLVTERLRDLTRSEVPVLLFLRRLSEVTVRVERGNEQDETVLTRACEQSPDLHPGIQCDVVALKRSERHLMFTQEVPPDDAVADAVALERYFVFTQEVPPDAVADAVREAVERHQLDPKWQKSTATVEVSIAVPYGTAGPLAGRFYTYLPLGAKAPSPFAGHLNAPFSTNLARTDIDATNPLNRLLLGAAASLCLDAAEALTGWHERRANCVLDVISWDAERVSILAEEATARGLPLTKRALLPTRASGWTSMEGACRWPAPQAEVLTAGRAGSACQIEFLPDLDPDRSDRLDATLAALELSADPLAEQLASWTETMLAAMLRERRPLSEWDQAYADVALLFARNPAALRSRRILLTDEWELRACASGARSTDAQGPRDATPFFPPARQRVDEEDDFDPDADLELPRSLKRRLFYLHSGLTWYTNRQQTPARSFLQDNRLVRRFDTRSIFEHIRGVLGDRRSGRSKAVARDALRLVFNLTRSGAATNVDLGELGLRVPTTEAEWIHAHEALFSSGWPDTTGGDLSLIASTPEHRSEELHALATRLLAAPATVLGTTDNVQVWVTFLRRIGVRDLIPLHELRDGRPIHGRSLTDVWLGQVPDLPELVRATWVQQLPQRSNAYFPDTPYKAVSPLYWLPGQANWRGLTDKVRRALCRQILLGLKEWDDAVLATGWDRDRAGDKDRRLVPTPLRAFLATTEWMPLQRPGSSLEEYVPPSQCWTFPIRGDETPPRFASLLSKRLRDLLDDDPKAVRLLRHLGLGIWGSPEDAPRLVRHLGQLVADSAVPDVHVAHFRNTYQRAWADCVRQTGTAPFPPESTSHLVADVGGTMTPLAIEPEGAEAEPLGLVVASTEDERSLIRLLADFRRPVLTVMSDADAVTTLLQARLGPQVVRATEVAPVVLIDGTEFAPTDAAAGTLITDIIPALPVLVATLLEFRRGSFSHIGQRAFEEALDVLRRVRLVRAREVEVRIGSDARPLPPRAQGVLSVPDSEYPALVLARGEAQDQLDWATLDALAEPLLYLIGRPDFATEFRLAATRMQASGAPLDALDPADLASACEVSVDDVQTTARRIESSMTPLLDRLYPIVAHYAGAQAAVQFDPDTSILSGEPDTREALARLDEKLPLDPGELLSLALDSGTLDGLRNSLHLPLSELNATLIALGGRHKPIDYSIQHADDFADHVRRTHHRTLDRVRWARWDRFAAFDPQPDLRTLRRADALTPDPAWGLTRDSLSIAEMDARIDAELERLLGTAPPSTGPELAPVNDCIKANSDLITTSIGTLTETVRAWLTVVGAPQELPWSDPQSAARSLLDALDGAGALDFTELGLDDVLRWLQALNIWPADMPPTINLEMLGLSPDDIEAQRSEEAHRKNEAARARRTVLIDNKPFDLAIGLTEFRAALEVSLEATPRFLTTRNRFAALREVSERPGGRGGSGGGPGGSTREPRLTDAQRDAIGFAGEWLAYKWLERLHDADFSPVCWVSAYREHAFPGSGDDGLGWDFQVPTGRGFRMYEVKTSQGDGGQIELGETQVLAAQKNARNELWRLLVITNVLNENRRIQMLRNPFDPKARGHYTFVGQGLRLRYTPE